MKFSNLILKFTFWLTALIILINSNLIFIYSNPILKSSIKAALAAPNFIQRNNYANWGYSMKFNPILKLSPMPTVETVSITTPENTLIADLWLPNTKDKKYPAVILTLGVEIERGDSRNVFLADTLSRLGFAVLVPELPGQIQGKFDLKDADYLVSVFKYLQSQDNIIKDKIGFLAYCGSSVLALIATENEAINNTISYVAVNNIFSDPFSLYKAGVEGKLKDQNDKTVNWKMNYKTTQVLNRYFIDTIENENDRKILTAFLVNQPEKILAERQFLKIPLPVFEKLTDEAKGVYEFLANNDPDQSELLINNLPDRIKEKASQASAIPKINNLKAKLFVIADKGNTFQPFTESYKFLSYLPKSKYHFLETTLLKDGALIKNLSLKKALTEGIKIFVFGTLFLTYAT